MRLCIPHSCSLGAIAQAGEIALEGAAGVAGVSAVGLDSACTAASATNVVAAGTAATAAAFDTMTDDSAVATAAGAAAVGLEFEEFVAIYREVLEQGMI